MIKVEVSQKEKHTEENKRKQKRKLQSPNINYSVILKDKFNVELSRFHINRIINDNNITLKITRIRHEPVKRFFNVVRKI